MELAEEHLKEETYVRMPKMGRPSTFANEDDYDYALELVPDEEYRQAAEELANIADF